MSKLIFEVLDRCHKSRVALCGAFLVPRAGATDFK